MKGSCDNYEMHGRSTPAIEAFDEVRNAVHSRWRGAQLSNCGLMLRFKKARRRCMRRLMQTLRSLGKEAVALAQFFGR